MVHICIKEKRTIKGSVAYSLVLRGYIFCLS